MLASCQTSVLDPLEGIFTPPTVVDNFSSASCDAYKADGKRVFVLHLGGQTNFEATLIGDAYYLTSNGYTEATEANAKKGNYVLGQTSVNGTQVENGTITISQDGEHYKMKAVLFLTDGTPYRLSWEGNLHFEPDPEPVVLTQVLSAQSNLGSGVQSVTVKLASADVTYSYDMATWSEVYGGEGNYLAIDFYSEDGYLHEGTYTASAVGGVIGPGEFGRGYDADWGDWGVFPNWGTCWWTVSGGATSAEKITSGTIIVSKTGTKYTVTWGSEETYPHWATFSGAIEALTPSAAPTPDYTYTDELSDPVDETFAPVAGVKTHNLTLKNKDGEEVAWFQLVLTEGVSDYSGDYVCKEYAHEDHTFGNGYDLSMWGMGMGGTRYMKDGAVVLVNPGETLSISKLGDDVWEVSGNGYDFIFGNGGGDVTPEYTISDELSDPVDETFAPVSGVKTHNLTLKNAAGEECAWFQLVLTEGSEQFEGEYICKEYAHEDHTFGNGYDLSMWGMGMGGTRYMKDGAVVLVNAGETLTVTKVGDGVYKFAGSTGYEFVGQF